MGAPWRMAGALVAEICAEHGLIHCVDPFETLPVYGDAIYWRLHGRGGYRYKYTDEDLQELQDALSAFADLPIPVMSCSTTCIPKTTPYGSWSD